MAVYTYAPTTSHGANAYNLFADIGLGVPAPIMDANGNPTQSNRVTINPDGTWPVFQSTSPALWFVNENGIKITLAPGAPGVNPNVAARTILAGHRVAWVGDSIGIGDNPNTAVADRLLYGNNPATYAMLSSDGRWKLMTNSCVRGRTSAQILASLIPDTTGATVAVINSCYWNDVTNSVPVTTTMANITSMVTQLRTANITPILGLPTPAAVADTTVHINAINLLHANAAYLADQLNLPAIDYMATLVDPATGTLKAGYNRDGTVHPNDAGYLAMGQAAQKVLDAVLPASASPLVGHSKYQYDILGGNGFYLSSTGGVGAGTAWNNVASPGVASIVTDVNVPGNLQQISSNSATTVQNLDLATTGWSVGDTLEVSGVITASGPGPFTLVLLTNLYPGGTTTGTELTFSQNVTRARFSLRITLPAGTTTVNTRQLIPANAGASTLAIGWMTVKNLTKLSVA